MLHNPQDPKISIDNLLVLVLAMISHLVKITAVFVFCWCAKPMFRHLKYCDVKMETWQFWGFPEPLRPLIDQCQDWCRIKGTLMNSFRSYIANIDKIPVIVLKNNQPRVIVNLGKIFYLLPEGETLPESMEGVNCMPIFQEYGRVRVAKCTHQLS